MSEDVGRRCSRDGYGDGDGIVDGGTTSVSTPRPEVSYKQLSESSPEPKRRRPSTIAAPPFDQGATTPRPVSASTSLSSATVLPDRTDTRSGALHSRNNLSARLGTPDPHSSRQHLSAPRRHSGPVRSETTHSSSSGGSSTASGYAPVGLARLPSLSSIAQDLPVTGHTSQHSPHKGLSSPASVRSRNSISSRGSSPHASSSSSSSSAGKRRYGSIAPDTGAISRSASQVPEFRYELVIHQQPGTAAAAGLSPPALSRLPIVPSPILQLKVTNENGAPVGNRDVLQNLPYLVCSCSLVPVDGDDNPIDFATEEQPLPPSMAGQSSAQKPSQPLAMMCGTRVYSLCEAVGRDGEQGLFFIFWDTSIRQEGQYRLKFSLIEALPGSPTLTSVISEPLKVVGRSEFPGTVEIATEWTRHMHRQGLNIYLPALGTSSGLLPNANSRA